MLIIYIIIFLFFLGWAVGGYSPATLSSTKYRTTNKNIIADIGCFEGLPIGDINLNYRRYRPFLG
jgi:hypothetical protein